MNKSPVLACNGLRKSYLQGQDCIEVLSGVGLTIREAERLAIIGRSGSGKSTLLHVLAGLVEPDEGYVELLGENLTIASQAKRAHLRNAHMGFVYQLHHLLPEFSALENVAMPLMIRGLSRREVFNEASGLLKSVGLAQRGSHRPHQLSGGERQRVAVARALVTSPAVVLADEPTGNLDRTSASQVLALIDELVSSTGTAFVVVTHDEALASQMDRTVILDEGVLS